MVIRPDIAAAALDYSAGNRPEDTSEWPIVCLSPRGRRFDDSIARSWSRKRGVTLFSCRFEGIDQRVIDDFEIEEISLGDFVLSGGEIAAQALIDATVSPYTARAGESGIGGMRIIFARIAGVPAVYASKDLARPTGAGKSLFPAIMLKLPHGARHSSERLTRERRPDLWRHFCAKHGRNYEGDS